MTDKQKTIFEIMAKYGQARGCEYLEIDIDPWNLIPYFSRTFGCGNQEHETQEKFPFDPTEIITEYLNSTDHKIDEDNLSSVSIRLYPESRKIIVSGTYQELADGQGHTIESSSEDDKHVKSIMDYMVEHDIYPYATVHFHGGGDSGYIEDELEVHSGEKSSVSVGSIPGLDEYLYEMLSEFGGWENDEGSWGEFTIDSRAGIITLNFTWNEYQYENVVFHEENF